MEEVLDGEQQQEEAGMQEQERDHVPAAADGQRAARQEQECERAGRVRAGGADGRAAGRDGAAAAAARRGLGARQRAQQQRVLLGEVAHDGGGPGGGAAQDCHPGLHLGAAQVPRPLPARAVPPAARLPGGRRRHVAADGRPVAALARMAGRGIHKPGERGVRVYAGPRVGRWGEDSPPPGVAGGGPHVPLPVLLVHGQRDILPPQAVLSGRL